VLPVSARGRDLRGEQDERIIMRTWLRWTIIWFAVLGLLALGALTWYHLPQTQRFYSDADQIRRSLADAAPRDVLWQPPAALSELLNTSSEDYEPRLSWDGLTLYFVRGKAGENADIYQSTRTPSGWSPPEPLAFLNTEYDELGPEPASDGESLYFYSDRPGGLGGYDLWVVHRSESGWSQPANLGPSVNTLYNDYGAALTPDGAQLYFASNRPRPGTPVPDDVQRWPATVREQHAVGQTYDLYTARITEAGVQPASLLVDLNTEYNEGAPCVSPAGDFLYFSSDRPGGAGGFDLYRARLQSPDGLIAESLDPPVNTAANELDPGLTALGYALYFSSDRVDPEPTSEATEGSEGITGALAISENAPSAPGDTPSVEGAGQTSTRAPGDVPPDYNLYYSSSREVFIDAESHRRPPLDWAGLLERTWPLWLPLLLLPLLLWLLRALWGGIHNRRLSLLARCLLASLLVHMIIMILLSFWQVGGMLSDAFRRGGRLHVMLGNAGAGDELAAQVRGQRSEIELPDSAAPTTEAVRAELAPQLPDRMQLMAVSSVTLHVPMPAQREAAVEDSAPELQDNGAPPSDLPQDATEMALALDLSTPLAEAPTEFEEAELEADEVTAVSPAAERSALTTQPTEAEIEPIETAAAAPNLELDQAADPLPLPDANATQDAQSPAVEGRRQPPVSPPSTTSDLALDLAMPATLAAASTTEPSEADAIVEAAQPRMQRKELDVGEAPQPVDVIDTTQQTTALEQDQAAEPMRLIDLAETAEAQAPTTDGTRSPLSTTPPPTTSTDLALDLAMPASEAAASTTEPSEADAIVEATQPQMQRKELDVGDVLQPVDVIDTTQQTTALEQDRAAEPLRLSDASDVHEAQAPTTDGARSPLSTTPPPTASTDLSLDLAMPASEAAASPDEGEFELDQEIAEAAAPPHQRAAIQPPPEPVQLADLDTSSFAASLEAVPPTEEVRPAELRLPDDARAASPATPNANLLTLDDALRPEAAQPDVALQLALPEADAHLATAEEQESILAPPALPTAERPPADDPLMEATSPEAASLLPSPDADPLALPVEESGARSPLSAEDPDPQPAEASSVFAGNVAPDNPLVALSIPFDLDLRTQASIEPTAPTEQADVSPAVASTRSIPPREEPPAQLEASVPWEAMPAASLEPIAPIESADGGSTRFAAGSEPQEGEAPVTTSPYPLGILDPPSEAATPQLALTLPDELELPAPVEKAEPDPGEVTGRVTHAETGEPIADAYVFLDLQDDQELVAVTDAAGRFVLPIPAGPDHVAVSATAPGFLPETVSVATRRVRREGFTQDFALEPITEEIIPLETVPEVHHLGNDRWEGRINSQFQKRAEGSHLRAVIILTDAQVDFARTIRMTLLAKGVQCPHPIYFNGHLLERPLASSPEDGSFGAFEVNIDPAYILPGENLLQIEGTSCRGDEDDFELVNIRLHLRRN
jgi:hypothetical protein